MNIDMYIYIIIGVIVAIAPILYNVFLHIKCKKYQSEELYSDQCILSTKERVEFIEKVAKSIKLVINVPKSTVGQRVDNKIVFDGKKFDIVISWDEFLKEGTHDICCKVVKKDGEIITQFCVDKNAVSTILDGPIKTILFVQKAMRDSEVKKINEQINEKKYGNRAKIQAISNMI